MASLDFWMNAMLHGKLVLHLVTSGLLDEITEADAQASVDALGALLRDVDPDGLQDHAKGWRALSGKRLQKKR